MDIKEYRSIINNAAQAIKKADSRAIETAIILGSGLGRIAEQLTETTVIPYREIPGFPVSTAIGHKGNLIIGKLDGTTILAMQGRFHYYEGYSMREVTLPVRIMSALGIKNLIVSNAAGGLNPSFRIGDIMLINDHINMAPNPLIGPNMEEFGPRFPDMGFAYDPSLGALAEKCAKELEIHLQKGIYVCVTGPTYETPAECGCYRNMGADAIGMSTVPEVIVARHCGIKVCGFSIITDLGKSWRIEGETIDGDMVVREADAASERIGSIVRAMLKSENPSI